MTNMQDDIRKIRGPKVYTADTAAVNDTLGSVLQRGTAALVGNVKFISFPSGYTESIGLLRESQHLSYDRQVSFSSLISLSEKSL